MCFVFTVLHRRAKGEKRRKKHLSIWKVGEREADEQNKETKWEQVGISALCSHVCERISGEQERRGRKMDS